MHDEFIMPALSEMRRALGEVEFARVGNFVNEDTAWAVDAGNKLAA